MNVVKCVWVTEPRECSDVTHGLAERPSDYGSFPRSATLASSLV